MTRADEFVELFNRLSDHLVRITGRDRSYSFSALVDQAGERNSAVRGEANRLKDYADLRNSIVHHRRYPREVIAEPTPRAVAEFGRIVERVISPKPLIPTFKADIRSFSPDERLVDALKYMRNNDFSQIVVRSDRLRMLTVEGVARWLEQQVEDPIIDVTDATVDEALGCESTRSFGLLDRRKTVYDAQEAFANALERGQPRLLALIVTENGKPTESPLGIVTPWDLLKNVAA